MISKKFIKSSIIYTVAGTLPMASAILLLPFYLHYLTAQQYGALALYLAFSILIQIIVTFSFDASLYLYFHEFKDNPDKLARYVSSSFSFVFLLAVALSAILLVGGNFLFQLTFKGQVDFFPFGIFSAVTAVFQSMFKMNNSFLQSRQEPLLFLWSNLLSFFLVASLTIGGLLLFPNSLMGPVGGRMVAFVISGVWVLTSIYGKFGIHLDKALLKATLPYNFYQAIYQLQQWVISYFDRILMVTLVSMVDLGSYDFAIKSLLLLDFVIAALFNSFFPKVLSKAAEQKLQGTTVEINRYYNGLTAASMLMVSGSILVLPLLVMWFVKKPGYVDAIQWIPYASLVYLLRSMRYFFGLPYSIRKQSKSLPLIFSIVSVTKIALSYGMILRYGVYGAIGATIFATLIEIFLLWFWMRKSFHYFFNPFKMIGGPLILLISVLVIEPFAQTHGQWMVHACYVILSVAVLGWFYRNELKLMKLSSS